MGGINREPPCKKHKNAAKTRFAQTIRRQNGDYHEKTFSLFTDVIHAYVCPDGSGMCGYR